MIKLDQIEPFTAGVELQDATSIGNWNFVTETGFYWGGFSGNKSPDPGGAHPFRYVKVLKHSGDFLIQESTDFYGVAVYTRTKQGTVWSAWKEEINATRLTGTPRTYTAKQTFSAGNIEVSPATLDTHPAQWGQVKALKEHEINGVRVTNNAVSGTYNIDYNAGSLWVLTLTGATTLAEVNIPTGTNTKTIELEIVGDYPCQVPARWVPRPSNDSYLGTVRNAFVVSSHSDTRAVYSLENLAT